MLDDEQKAIVREIAHEEAKVLLNDAEARLQNAIATGVDSGIRSAFMAYGLDADSQLSMQQDMAWVRGWRITSDEVKKWTLRTVVVTFITGIIGLLIVALQRGGQ